MNRKQLLARVEAADAHHHLAQQELVVAWQPWRTRLHKHKAGLAVGGSFLVGALMARSPGRLLMRGVSVVAGLASLALRTPLGSMLIASMGTLRSAAADALPRDK